MKGEVSCQSVIEIINIWNAFIKVSWLSALPMTNSNWDLPYTRETSRTPFTSDMGGSQRTSQAHVSMVHPSPSILHSAAALVAYPQQDSRLHRRCHANPRVRLPCLWQSSTHVRRSPVMHGPIWGIYNIIRYNGPGGLSILHTERGCAAAGGLKLYCTK